MTIVYHDVKQRSPEWHKIRGNKKITASKAGNYLGLNPNVDAYRAIDNLRFGLEEKVNEYHCNRGEKLEPMALRDLELEKNIVIMDMGCFEFDKWLVGSPDGISSDRATVEVKCPVVLPDCPHDTHVVQCMINMFLMNTSKCYLYYYTVAHGSRLFEIEYNSDLAQSWIASLKNIYYLVKKPMDDFEKELLKDIKDYKKIKNAIDEKEKEVDVIKSRIEAALVNVDKIQLAGHTVQRITRAGGYDYKKFLIDNNIKMDENYKNKDVTYLRIN